MTRQASKALKTAFILNTGFFIVEIVGGLLTGSIAILADAVHDFGDSVGLGVSLWLEKKSFKKRDEDLSYGYARYSIFSQALSSVLILMGSVYIFTECLGRLQNPTQAPQGLGMAALSVLGILVNGFAVFKLGGFTKHSHDHSHDGHAHHGHSHAHLSGSERLYSLHLLEDALGWVFVLAGAIGIMATGWWWIDPALGLMLSLFVAFNVMRHSGTLRDILLQKTPKQFRLKEFHQKSKTIPNLESIHDLHVWTLDGVRHVLSAHAVVKPGLSAVEIQNILKALQKIVAEWGQFHMTIETETSQENCRENCDDHS